mgnify:FL=1
MEMGNILKERIKNSIKFKILKQFLNELPFYIFDYLIIFYSFLKNIIFYRKFYKKDLVLVSASDEVFAESLNQLLENISNLKHISKIVIYDLGMNSQQIKNIKTQFPNVKLKFFDFSKYPKFFQERDEYGKLGGYGWKPSIIHKEMQINKSQVVWLDTGNLLDKKFSLVRVVLSAKGFFSPISAGKLQDYTNPDTLKYLNIDNKYLDKRMLTGGFVCFDWENNDSIKLLDDWKDLSEKKEIIVPEGSTPLNHKSDQSILSALFYSQAKFFYSPKIKRIFGIQVNQNPNRFFYLVDAIENSIGETIRENWYKNYKNISTLTIKDSEIVWILNFEKLQKVPNKMLKKKRIVLSIFEDESEDFLNEFKSQISNKRLRKIDSFLTNNRELYNILIAKNLDTLFLEELSTDYLKDKLVEHFI